MALTYICVNIALKADQTPQGADFESFSDFTDGRMKGKPEALRRTYPILATQFDRTNKLRNLLISSLSKVRFDRTSPFL